MTRIFHNLAAVAPHRSWLGALLRLPLKLMPRSIAIPVLSGPLRGRRWIVGAATHGCWLGTYELAKQLAFVEVIRPGDTVCDIGAHSGYYTLLGASAAGSKGRVYAFEPLPRNLDYLRRHLALNRLTNAEVIEGVVGNMSGRVSFSTRSDHTQGRIAEQGDLMVESFVLDELVSSERISTPKVVKIDVEGAELSVLTGAHRTIEKYGPTFLLATHGSVARVECLEFLGARGYSAKPLDGPTVEEASEFLCIGRGHAA